MNQTIFITATNTDIGKTYATQHLIAQFTQMGYKVGAVKPIETGVEDIPLDATKLLKAVKTDNENWKDFSIDDMCWYQYSLPAAPFVAKLDDSIDMHDIKARIKNLQETCDILLVEGAGGLMVPIEADYFMIDFAKDVADNTLLVAPSRLGSINDTLLSSYMLQQQNVPFVRAVNVYEDALSFDAVTKPFYDATGGVLTLQEDLETICMQLIASKN